MHKRLSKKELRELQEQMLLNKMGERKIIFSHYKNKQLKQRGKNENEKIRGLATNG